MGSACYRPLSNRNSIFLCRDISFFRSISSRNYNSSLCSTYKTKL